MIQPLGSRLRLRAASTPSSSSKRRRIGRRAVQIRLTIRNRTDVCSVDESGRDQLLLRSMVSAHSILHVTGGEFVSLMDPPDQFRAAAAGMPQRGYLAGAGWRRGSAGLIAIFPDHPVRLSRSCARESRRSFRWIGNRRDSGAAHPHAHRRREARSSKWRRARPGNSRKNRNASAGAFPKTSWGAARTSTKLGGGAMNEWEFNLLEDKPSLESVEAGGVEDQGWGSCSFAARGRRRHHGCGASRQSRDASKASSRTMKERFKLRW